MSPRPRPRRPLSRILVARLAAATGVAITLLIVSLLVLLHHHVHRQTDQMLLRLARQDAADALHEPEEGIHVHESPLSVPSLQGTVAAKYAFILNSQCALAARTENVIAGSAPTPLCALHGPEGSHAFVDLDGVAPVQLRVVALRSRGPDGALYTFVVGVNHDDIDASLWWSTAAAAPIGLLAILAITLAGWSTQRRATSELAHIRAQCEALDGPQLRDLAAWRQRLLAIDPTVEETAVLATTIADLAERVDHMIQAQDRFIAEAAHELRTPLTALRGELELALRRPRSAEEYRETLTWLSQDAERLIALSERLLDAAQAQRRRLDLRAAALRPIFEDALARSRGVLEAAGVAVDLQMPGDLYADCDPAALEQVIDNLVSNAARHAEASALTVSAQREGQSEGEAITVELADNGQGIPAAAAATLFEPFQRSGRGHGLGLFLSRSLMRRQGGDLQHLPTKAGTRWRLTFQPPGSQGIKRRGA